jgi:hypothetical protein
MGQVIKDQKILAWLAHFQFAINRMGNGIQKYHFSLRKKLNWVKNGKAIK